MLGRIVRASGMGRRAAWIRDTAGDLRWQAGRRALMGIRSMQGSDRVKNLTSIPKIGNLDVGNALHNGVQLGLRSIYAVVDDLRR